MCSGLSFLLAATNRFSTVSAPGSSRKYAMSAKLSSTLADMAILQFLFFVLVFRPFLDQALAACLALDNPAPLFNEGGGHWLEQYAFGRCLNHRFCSILNMKLFAQPSRNHDLPFSGKPTGISF